MKKIISAKIPLPRPTVPALLSTIAEQFNGDGTILALEYRRGQPLYVDRQVSDKFKVETPWLGIYQTVRQYADLVSVPGTGDSLHKLCDALQQIHDEGLYPIFCLCRDVHAVSRWADGFTVEAVVHTPLYTDTETPDNYLFICATNEGRTTSDVTYGVMIELEE